MPSEYIYCIRDCHAYARNVRLKEKNPHDRVDIYVPMQELDYERLQGWDKAGPHVEFFGNPRNPTLVCIHGAWENGDIFIQTPDGNPGWAIELANDHFVAVAEWPSTKKSMGLADKDATYVVLVDRYAQYLQGEQNLTIMAHSMGGPVALTLAERLGERVKNIILLEPTPPANGDLLPPIPPDYEDDNLVQFTQKGIRHTLHKHERRLPTDAFVQKMIAPAEFPKDPASLERFVNSLEAIHNRFREERYNVVGSPMIAIETPENLTHLRVLIVSSGNNPQHDEEDLRLAAYFAPHVKQMAYLNLWDAGYKHNGHMMMIERNNRDILAMITTWLREEIPQRAIIFDNSLRR